jgi:hypothetical protein
MDQSYKISVETSFVRIDITDDTGIAITLFIPWQNAQQMAVLLLNAASAARDYEATYS